MSDSGGAGMTTSGRTTECLCGLSKCVRCVICGIMFGLPLCTIAPLSPLLKLSLSKENKKMLVPRMMGDFFWVNSLASLLAYYNFIEARAPHGHMSGPCRGWLPYLGPLTALIPGFACLLASHTFYPGMWALFNEVTWSERRRVFCRLNIKCFIAFAPIHVPAVVAVSVVVGSVLFPFKMLKNRRYKSDGVAHLC